MLRADSTLITAM